MSEIRSRILGLGGYLPPRIVTNKDLEGRMDTTHEWILERTGIEQRHWVDEGEGGAEMGAKAARAACKDAGIDVSDIDLVILATLSPDQNFPGTGVFVARELGISDTGVPCLDIRQQCTGFLYGLSIADAYIRCGMYENILLVGSEVHSTGLDISTRGRDVAVIFGDGAGAAIIGVAADPATSSILSCHLHADGSEAEILWTEKPGSRYHPRITHEDLDAGAHYPKMQGRRVFKHAVTRMPQALMEGMVANELKLEDIDMVIPHQANLRINEFVAKMAGLPPERMHNNIHKVGNTTAASIPLCMLDAIDAGKIKRGDTVALVAFGAGMTWGSVFVRY
jgi:3-oxoacyl-[acyl-carrier-protein] synthase-3